MRIRLDEKDVEKVWNFAEEKQAYKDKHKVRSNRRSSFSEIDVQVIGTLGEVALAKHLGLKADLSIHKKGDKYDFEFRGHRLEVKTTTTSGLKLYDYIAEKTLTNSDIMVLMCVDKMRALQKKSRFVDVDFVGYIPTASYFYQVMQKGKTIKKPNYTMYVLPEDVLYLPQTIKNIDSRF